MCLGQTLHLYATGVNRLLTPMTAEEGERLREFLRRATGGGHGWVSELARQAGLRRGTLYTWFEGKSEPTLETLGELARATGTSRSEIVAAMDGRAPEPLEDRLAAVERVLEQMLAERPPGPEGEGSPVPRAPRATAG
jgi:DNA-binding phage protein